MIAEVQEHSLALASTVATYIDQHVTRHQQEQEQQAKRDNAQARITAAQNFMKPFKDVLAHDKRMEIKVTTPWDSTINASVPVLQITVSLKEEEFHYVPIIVDFLKESRGDPSPSTL
jgi:hypothetical protein